MAVQFVAMVADQENKGVVVKSIPLKSGYNLSNLIIGEKQAIVMMSNLLTYLGNIRVVRRHRHFIQWGHLLGSSTGLSSRDLNLTEKRFTLGSPRPLGSILGSLKIPTTRVMVINFIPVEFEIKIILSASFIKSVVTCVPKDFGYQLHSLGQNILVILPHRLASKIGTATTVLMCPNRSLHHAQDCT